MTPSPLTSFRQQIEKKCSHGVVEKFCFNCRFKERRGMKVEMFNSHHYVRLKDAEKAISSALTQQLSLVEEEVKSMKEEHCGRGDCGQGQCLTRKIRKETLDALLTRLKSGNEEQK